MSRNAIFASLFPFTAPQQQPRYPMDERPTESPDPTMGTGIDPRMIDVAAQIGRAVRGDDPPQEAPILDGGSARQPIEQTQDFPSAMQRPVMVGKEDSKPVRPDFAYPYPMAQSGYEQAQNALAEGYYDVQHPKNKDKGVKGFLKELVQNFGTGMSQGRPGMNAKKVLALGAAGAGVGVANRSWNEEREAAQKLPLLQQQAKLAGEELDATAKRDLTKAQSDYYSGRNDVTQKAIEQRANVAEMNNLTRQYNAAPSYSESDLDDKAFGDRFEKVYHYRPLEKNADTKSEQLINQSDGQVYIIQTDKQGGQKVLKLTLEDGSPFTIQTKEQLTSADKAKQRELQKLIADNRNVTSVNVANINAGSRRDVAGINQAGATGRADMKSATDAAKVIAAIRQNAPKGATPEQIQQKVDAYLQSLPADVRSKLP